VSQEVLNPAQFFHGSNAKLEPGKDQITPGRKHTYFTEHKPTAAHLGKYTYTVQPTGSYEPDDGGMRDSHKSAQPLNILKREDS